MFTPTPEILKDLYTQLTVYQCGDNRFPRKYRISTLVVCVNYVVAFVILLFPTDSAQCLSWTM